MFFPPIVKFDENPCFFDVQNVEKQPYMDFFDSQRLTCSRLVEPRNVVGRSSMRLGVPSRSLSRATNPSKSIKMINLCQSCEKTQLTQKVKNHENARFLLLFILGVRRKKFKNVRDFVHF